MSDVRPRILLLDAKVRGHFYEEIREALDAEWVEGPLNEPAPLEGEEIDIVLVSDEYSSHVTPYMCEYVRRGVPTLHAADGIVEWRNTWENPRSLSQERGMPLFQPILAHKIACLGRSQARILEAWGNLGKCEIVGGPRFDKLLGRKPRQRPPGEPLRVLIMTAKAPGFTPEQIALTKRSLQDLKSWLGQNPKMAGVATEPVWRLTGDLPDELGVSTHTSDFTGKELGDLLASMDAVITTPSTAMIEGMLQGVPVALLDYSDCPHYVPTAWTISAPEHIPSVLPELISPPLAKMVYQDGILHDALECRTPATPRMVQVIEKMITIGRESRAKGCPLAFPRRILSDSQDAHHLPEELFDLTKLYPDHPVFSVMDRVRLQAELGHLLRLRDIWAEADEERVRVTGELGRLAAAYDRLTAEHKGLAAEKLRFETSYNYFINRRPIRAYRAVKRLLSSIFRARDKTNVGS